MLSIQGGVVGLIIAASYYVLWLFYRNIRRKDLNEITLLRREIFDRDVQSVKKKIHADIASTDIDELLKSE